MRIYFNVSCLNRPFDDQGQARIRLESEAVTLIIERCDRGDWTQSSEIAQIEIDAIPDAARRLRVQQLLPDRKAIMDLSQSAWDRGADLEKLGFKAADALHVAAAEELQADVLLSCDDRFCRLGRRQRRHLKVSIANPIDWLKEMENVPDA